MNKCVNCDDGDIIIERLLTEVNTGKTGTTEFCLNCGNKENIIIKGED